MHAQQLLYEEKFIDDRFLSALEKWASGGKVWLSRERFLESVVLMSMVVNGSLYCKVNIQLQSESEIPPLLMS